MGKSQSRQQPKQVKRRTGVPGLTLTARQVNTVAENVAKKLKLHEDQRRTGEVDAAQNLFTVFMQRFDRVDKDNTEIKVALATHITDDAKVHKVVEQHQTYWGIAIKSLIGLCTGVFALLLGWISGLLKIG